MHPEVRRYYDEAFDEVNNAGVSGWATRQFHRAIERPFPSNSFFDQVLELGAAHGEHSKFVRHGFNRYLMTDLDNHGIDLDQLESEIPRGAGSRQLGFQVADALDLPFPDASFDRTVHTCLMHHLTSPETAFSEMRRVLRPGGTASIYLPCDPGLVYLATQRITTGRKQRRLLKRDGYEISPGYLRAQEHPNHYLALRAILLHAFREDEIHETNFPLPWPSYNINYYTIFHVRIMK